MTKQACVIGDPISHSRSPAIHGYWLARYDIDGAYDKRRVATDDLNDFLDLIRKGQLAGCNVTTPHKETVARMVDLRTPTAQALGAVNTVWMQNGTLCGDNTDVAGFLGNLDDRQPGWDNRRDKAVVLGAGGAARAIAYGLQQRGFATISICNRSAARAHHLAEELAGGAGGYLKVIPWDDRSTALDGADVLVNTTTLGMSGQPPLDIDLAALPGDAVVNDIVYAPLETDLLQVARLSGRTAVDGLGMLLHQAAPGFQRWFGVLPGVTDDLRNLIINQMTGRAA